MAPSPRRAVMAAFGLAAAAVLAIDLAGLLLGDAAAAGGAQAVVTNLVLKLILELFLLGSLQLFLRWDSLRRFAGQIPGHLTALGILGTFIGIFVGLYNFQVDRLDLAVPELLEGMKIAFSTSIVGLAAATLLRIGHSIAVSVDPDDPFKPRSEFQHALQQGRASVAAETMNGTGLSTEGLEFLIMLTDESFERMMSRLVRLRSEMDDQIADLDRRSEAMSRHTDEMQRHHDEVVRAVDLGLRAREGR